MGRALQFVAPYPYSAPSGFFLGSLQVSFQFQPIHSNWEWFIYPVHDNWNDFEEGRGRSKFEHVIVSLKALRFVVTKWFSKKKKEMQA